MKVLVGPFSSSNPQQAASNNNMPVTSRGLRGLPKDPRPVTTSQGEYQLLKQEAAQIEQWWSNKDRWGHTTRPYSGKKAV
jgi:hypothetical protein